ncbi:MAG: hypothetical protein AUI83_20240 [Armatimonadetes bacterium 13_1_40CM_3_65_7]|nr:MAG: hypothetical protein AUI83_20240 [Armatimonadetes bacterium 13_1_40CM_3_65_7]
MFDLQRLDGLLQVGRRPLDLDRVSDRNSIVGDSDRGDGDLRVEMEDLADFLPFERHCGCMGPPR